MSGKTDSAEHLGLGTLTSLIPNKASIMEDLKLGAGAALGIVATDLLLSRVLVKDGTPIVPEKFSPIAIALGGILIGGLVGKKINKSMGTGMIAGTVGVAISAVVAKFTSPAAAATAAAASSAEVSGYGPQQTAGFGLGRAFAPGLSGFSGAGPTSLFGVGTPDMSASRMFNGATVSIEEGGPMAGASVQYEEAGNFAGTFN